MPQSRHGSTSGEVHCLLLNCHFSFASPGAGVCTRVRAFSLPLLSARIKGFRVIQASQIKNVAVMKLPLRFDSDYHGDLLHWRASLSFTTPPVSKANAQSTTTGWPPSWRFPLQRSSFIASHQYISTSLLLQPNSICFSLSFSLVLSLWFHFGHERWY